MQPDSLPDGDGVRAAAAVADNPGVLGRARVRLDSRRLDRALAAGTRSEATPALALRARRLISPSQRRSIAASYRRILGEAREYEAPVRHRVPPARARVRAARRELTRLAETLAQPGPVAARGVAEAQLLLTDGTGPLYNPRNGLSLRECAARAASDLALPAAR